MEKNINYESPQMREIVIAADGLLCASVFGTEGVGDYSDVYDVDNWQIN